MVDVAPVRGEGGRVRGEEQRGHAVVPQHGLEEPEVLLVAGMVAVAVVAELVLYLRHDDGAALLPLLPRHAPQQLLQVQPGTVLRGGKRVVYRI